MTSTSNLRNWSCCNSTNSEGSYRKKEEPNLLKQFLFKYWEGNFHIMSKKTIELNAIKKKSGRWALCAKTAVSDGKGKQGVS